MDKNLLQLSCLPVSLFQAFFDGTTDLRTWSEQAKQLGLDCVDINIRCLKDLPISAAEALAETLPAPVLMVTTYSDFTNPDPECRKQAVELAKHHIAMTAALRGKYLRLTAGQAYPGLSEDAAIDGVYDCFTACVPAAEAAGVRLLIENHSKPGAWQYDDFDFHLQRMIRLWEKLRELPIGVNYDTANGFALQDWKQLLEVFRGRIETVHVNDLRSVQPLKFCCVGDGIVPIGEQLDALFSDGFHGHICIEEAGMEGLAGIARSVSATRRLLDQISA